MSIPKYEVIYNDICNKIRQQIYKPGDMLPTEFEMTKEYDVSRITIQKALQMFSSKGIIERIPSKGTFIRSTVENVQSNANSKFISLILQKSTHEMMQIISSVQNIAQQKGYNLTIHFLEKTHYDSQSIFDKIINNDGSSGIVFYPSNSVFDVQYLRTIQKNIPLVLIDNTIDNLAINAVVSDNFSGMYELTQNLINNNHRKIAYFTYDYKCNSLISRLSGYKSALYNNDIPVDEKNICIVKSSKVVNEAMTAFFNSMTEKVTAIMCCTDEMAIECVSWLKANKYRIPEDISICGFDNSYYGQAAFPELTTESQNYDQLGTTATDLLFKQIEEHDQKKYVVYVPTNIVDRGSVKRLDKDLMDL